MCVKVEQSPLTFPCSKVSDVPGGGPLCLDPDGNLPGQDAPSSGLGMLGVEWS